LLQGCVPGGVTENLARSYNQNHDRPGSGSHCVIPSSRKFRTSSHRTETSRRITFSRSTSVLSNSETLQSLWTCGVLHSHRPSVRSGPKYGASPRQLPVLNGVGDSQCFTRKDWSQAHNRTSGTSQILCRICRSGIHTYSLARRRWFRAMKPAPNQ
jgi:hypothetical protein